MKNKAFYFKSSGFRLSGTLETPKISNNHLVIFLHGLTNSSADCPLISEASKKLLRNGFSIFKFDYYGSGKSQGQFMNKTLKILYQNTLDALKYSNKNLGFKNIGLWGRSFGGILASTVCNNPHVFSSVIVSSTIKTNKTLKHCFKKNEPFSVPMKGTGTIKGKPLLPYQFYKETKWIDRLQKEHLTKSKNILVMQGTKDTTIGKTEHAKEIYNLVKGRKKIKLIKGADHSFKGYEEKVLKEAAGWLNKSLRK